MLAACGKLVHAKGLLGCAQSMEGPCATRGAWASSELSRKTRLHKNNFLKVCSPALKMNSMSSEALAPPKYALASDSMYAPVSRQGVDRALGILAAKESPEGVAGGTWHIRTPSYKS